MTCTTSDNVSFERSPSEIEIEFSPGFSRQCYPTLGDWIRRGNPASIHARRRSLPSAHVVYWTPPGVWDGLCDVCLWSASGHAPGCPEAFWADAA